MGRRPPTGNSPLPSLAATKSKALIRMHGFISSRGSRALFVGQAASILLGRKPAGEMHLSNASPPRPSSALAHKILTRKEEDHPSTPPPQGSAKQERMAYPPGHPSTRPLYGDPVIIYMTPEMERERDRLLATALVACLDPGRRHPAVRTAVCSRLAAAPEDVKVTLHYPEDYLIQFTHARHRDAGVALGGFACDRDDGGLEYISVRPWHEGGTRCHMREDGTVVFNDPDPMEARLASSSSSGPPTAAANTSTMPPEHNGSARWRRRSGDGRLRARHRRATRRRVCFLLLCT